MLTLKDEKSSPREENKSAILQANTSRKVTLDITIEALEHELHNNENPAVLILDLNGIITSLNEVAEKIKGYTANEILGKNYSIFYTPEDRENQLAEKLLEEVRKKRKISYEGWLLRKDGSRFWAEMTLTALPDRTGNICRFVKVTRVLPGKID